VVAGHKKSWIRQDSALVWFPW